MCGPIYVKFFIRMQQNAAIIFEIMLESSIIRALCSALLLLDDKEEVAKKNSARRSICVKPWLKEGLN